MARVQGGWLMTIERSVMMAIKVDKVLYEKPVNDGATTTVKVNFAVEVQINWPPSGESGSGSIWVGGALFDSFGRVRVEDVTRGDLVPEGWWLYRAKYYMHDGSLVEAIINNVEQTHRLVRGE